MPITPNIQDIRNFPKTYRGLCERYLPRPLHDDAGYEEAQRAIRPLMGFESCLTCDQMDYLEAVSTFIELYQSETIRWPKSNPLDALKYLLGEHGMSGAALARLLGVDASLGAKILRGERRLTVDHVRILSAHFSVNSQLFVG